MHCSCAGQWDWWACPVGGTGSPAGGAQQRVGDEGSRTFGSSLAAPGEQQCPPRGVGKMEKLGRVGDKEGKKSPQAVPNPGHPWPKLRQSLPPGFATEPLQTGAVTGLVAFAAAPAGCGCDCNCGCGHGSAVAVAVAMAVAVAGAVTAAVALAAAAAVAEAVAVVAPVSVAVATHLAVTMAGVVAVAVTATTAAAVSVAVAMDETVGGSCSCGCGCKSK